jgi:arginase family enzyme
MATAISIGAQADVPRAIGATSAASSPVNVTPLVIGGDHFVTYPVLKAFAKYTARVVFVHFDAHRDVEPDPGGRIDHGTMFNYAISRRADRSEPCHPDRHPHLLCRREELLNEDPVRR